MRSSFIYIFLIFIVALPCSLAKPTFKSPHDLDVTDILIGASHLHCATSFPVYVELKNQGTSSERVVVTLVSSSLHIEETSSYVTLGPGATDVLPFELSFSDAPQGDHEFQALVFFQQHAQTFFKTFSFSCTPSVTPAVLDFSTSPLSPLNVHTEQPTPSFSLTSLLTVLLVFMVSILGILVVIRRLYA